MNIMKIGMLNRPQCAKTNNVKNSRQVITEPNSVDSFSFKGGSREAYIQAFDKEFNFLAKGESFVAKCFTRLHEAAINMPSIMINADFQEWRPLGLKFIMRKLAIPGEGGIDKYHDQLAHVAENHFTLIKTIDEDAGRKVATITNYGKFEDENLLTRLARGYSDRHVEIDFFDLDPNKDRRIVFGRNYYGQLKLSQIDNTTGFFRQRTIFQDHKGLRQEIVSSPEDYSRAIITNYNEDGTKFTNTDEVVDMLANGMYKIFGKIFS